MIDGQEQAFFEAVALEAEAKILVVKLDALRMRIYRRPFSAQTKKDIGQEAEGIVRPFASLVERLAPGNR